MPCEWYEPVCANCPARAWNSVAFAIDGAYSSACGRGPSCVGRNLASGDCMKGWRVRKHTVLGTLTDTEHWREDGDLCWVTPQRPARLALVEEAEKSGERASEPGLGQS